MRAAARLSAFVVAAAAMAVALFEPAVLQAQAPRSASLSVTQNDAGLAASVSLEGPGGAGGYHPSRVIVRFRNGPGILPNTANVRALAVTEGVYLADTPPGLTVRETIDRYRVNPNVLYAEPDYVVSAILTPNDPDFNDATQWDMTKIAAKAAWDLHTNSSNVVVAIVDTGIDYSHPDLIANLYSDIADPNIHGYTCSGGTCNPGGMDDHGHGTHVAGTIGAVGNNGVGMAGINWNVKLLSIKFLGANGSGSTSDAVAGFVKLRQLKMAGVNIRVTNNSWGGGGYSSALKEAMAALEDTPGYSGTLNVCAAGNSGVNADFAPMYPAAYDNRGIVSVLATDHVDVGAGFTNFGLMSTDIAAPGVSTYSTIPNGTCSLCVAPGAPPYRTLSGTSMASPHVAGVAAALLDMHPALTAAEARDVMLHPSSYDGMTDSKAQSTSSGGRLNFYKTLTSPLLSGDPITLNTFPTVTVGPDVVAAAGGVVDFTATSSDADNDTLRMSKGRGAVSAWLFGWQANNLFPAAVPFLAPGVARTAEMNYDTSVADNKGGGASGRNWAVVTPAPDAGEPPTATLTVPATGSVGVPVLITFAPVDPEGKPVAWDIWASGNGGSSGWCCYSGTGVNITFNTPGVYRIGAQAIDRELLTSANHTAVISIDGATGAPPIALAALDKESGAAPLTVNVDMSGSSDPDGSISYYYIGCGGGFTPASSQPTGSCTFTQPGTYWLLLQARDNTGLMGITSKYVVVTPDLGPAPPPPVDTTKPTVSITSPASGANLSGTVNLEANASDNPGGSGVKEVEYFLDSITPGASLGKASSAPYTVQWNVSGTAPGNHTVYAVATDHANNASSPAAVTVSVNVVLPMVTLMTPANGQTVARKGTVQMTSTVTPGTYPVAPNRVDYLVNGAVACSGTNPAQSFSCNWKVPAAVKTYTVQARVVDDHGNVGLSATHTINAR